MIFQNPANGLQIITELLELTRRMSKSSDPDFLIEAIERRGELMSEYDERKAASPRFAADLDTVKPQISEMINEIIELDKKISKTLYSMYHDAKADLQNSNKNNKILNYTNQAISSSGSYMDFKE